MKILIACEESQVECIAFRKAGHEAYSCDLQECSGGHPEWHIQGDVLPLLERLDNGNNRSRHLFFNTSDGVGHSVEKWDMIIAHPPCTFLSNAGSVRMFPAGCLDFERYRKMQEAAEFFYRFLYADCDKICVENPVPMKICGLPDYSQIVSPHEFGSDYRKTTCYWLKNLPPLIQSCRTLDPIPCSKAAWFQRGGIERQKNRSKSFPEIAEAMVQQWS